MLCDFVRMFHPEKVWKDKKLTDMNPCEKCNTYKEARRNYSELPDMCKYCIPKILWKVDCMEKLKWYEDNDKNLNKAKEDG